jgi:hypothetical protein
MGAPSSTAKEGLMSSMRARLRAAVAVALTVALLTPPAYAQGKLRQYTWTEAQNLQVGAEITLTLTGNPPAKVRVWYVDDTTLVTSAPAPPKLPRDVRDVLARMGGNWRLVLRGGAFVSGSIRIAPDGVFKDTKKLADVTQVAQVAPRDRVAAIEVQPSHRTRNILIAIGVVLAVWIVGALIVYIYE